jgi:alpha-L-fucosidase
VAGYPRQNLPPSISLTASLYTAKSNPTSRAPDVLSQRDLYEFQKMKTKNFPLFLRVSAGALVGLTLGTFSPALGQESVTSPAAQPAPVDFATLQFIAPGDSAAVIAEKAAKVLPRPNQTAWMRLERTFFLHFGPNTFRGVEWGNGREEPSLFNPTALDANQWVTAMKEAGCNLLILVAKHHDGLCLWPSRYTSHSVASSPWRGGKGDLVREVAAAARAQGIKLGIYLSPADLYQLRTNPRNPAGYYGNGNPKVRSVIPTAPASFQSDPSQGRVPTPGFPSFIYEADDYNRYFLNQLYELLTEYGPISVAWFDGANPDPSVHQTYDYAAWYDLIRSLQPDAVISVKGPDVRWVGNEGGVGRTTEWSVIPLAQPPERFTWPDMHGALGDREKLQPGSYLWWYPAEVNTPILHGWFWAEGKRVKSPANLVDYYYTSVGRNGVMLLNLSPDTRGLIPDNQLASLSKMARVVEDTFARDLAAKAKFTADSSHPENGPSLAQDGSLDTWWEAAPGNHRATFTLSLPAAVTFDVVSLQEAVDHRSQRIESFVIETLSGGAWSAPATVEEQTTVGRKRLMRLTVPVTTDQVRVRITGSRLEPTLAEIGLFKQALPAAPVISDRSRDGWMTITHPHPAPIVYTLDGTEPTAQSPVYRSPIPLPRGGTVKAAVLASEGHLGLLESKTVVGIAPGSWKVVPPAEEETGFPAALAIDGDAGTYWKVRATTGPAPRRTLTVDMGAPQRIAGFAYLPRQDWSSESAVDRCRLETSLDGTTWTTQMKDQHFGNIRNNPILQEVRFAPVEARFFRFTALHDLDDNGWVGAAELTVLPAE